MSFKVVKEKDKDGRVKYSLMTDMGVIHCNNCHAPIDPFDFFYCEERNVFECRVCMVEEEHHYGKDGFRKGEVSRKDHINYHITEIKRCL